MVQKRREDTPLRQRFLTGKYFLLAGLLNYAVKHSPTPNLFLLGYLLYTKIDTLRRAIARFLYVLG